MAYRLPAAALLHALRHLCRYGDTDVFPHLPELSFFEENEDKIVQELEGLDLDIYAPSSAFEALGPKSRYGFRIVHQLTAVDTLLLLGCVIEIGGAIEAHRPPGKGIEAYSYRFNLSGRGSVFESDRNYKNWLNAQMELINSTLKIKSVVATDISDFYARINFHRLENLLNEVAPGHGAARFIIKHIKVIRARQSFGLPVGGSAARLLAELALSDTDRAIAREGMSATRFVDDFRIFLRADQNAYDALAFIAEQLGINEGLSLNVAKTAVYSRVEYVEKLEHQLTGADGEAEQGALDALTSDLYFDDDPDEVELDELKSMNLLGFLQEEVGKDTFDMGRVKVIFRALKLAAPEEAIDYLRDNFSELVVFSKEVSLLMQALNVEYPGCFNDLGDEVAEAIISPPASSIQLIRTWLLELYVRGVVSVEARHIKMLERLTTDSDKRQLHLIRARATDTNFFRKNKTAFGQLSPSERSFFIWGASCLPKDEYETWLQTIRPMFTGPTGALFLRWAHQERGALMDKLEAAPHDHFE